MPGSTPPTSQLDWLISTTAMIVLSWSRATRDLLKSFGWGIRALHQLDAATMVPSPRRLPHTISPLEEEGFEPSVPRDRVMVFSRTLRPDSFPEIDPRSEPFSLHPQNLPYRCAVIERRMSPQTGEAMTKRDRRPVAFNLTISL